MRTMKTKSIIVVIALIISFLGCNAQNETKQADFLELTGPYLGQKPPGMIPEIFAPGIVSSKEYVESNCVIWDDGNHILFFRINVGKLETTLSSNIWDTLRKTDEWGGPTLLHFISPDAKTMYYNYFGHVPAGSKARTSPLFVKHNLNNK